MADCNVKKVKLRDCPAMFNETNKIDLESSDMQELSGKGSLVHMQWHEHAKPPATPLPRSPC